MAYLTGKRPWQGLTRGHKTCGKKRIVSPGLFAMFHNDTDRRDFISMGAGAGFAAVHACNSLPRMHYMVISLQRHGSF